MHAYMHSLINIVTNIIYYIRTPKKIYATPLLSHTQQLDASKQIHSIIIV